MVGVSAPACSPSLTWPPPGLANMKGAYSTHVSIVLSLLLCKEGCAASISSLPPDPV